MEENFQFEEQSVPTDSNIADAQSAQESDERPNITAAPESVPAQDTSQTAVPDNASPQSAEPNSEPALIADPQSVEAAMRREVEAFAKAYPGVTELPDAVLNDIVKNGCTPVEAYQRHIIAEQAAQIQALKKMTTPGSVKTQGSVTHDEFLSNF